MKRLEAKVAHLSGLTPTKQNQLLEKCRIQIEENNKLKLELQLLKGTSNSKDKELERYKKEVNALKDVLTQYHSFHTTDHLDDNNSYNNNNNNNDNDSTSRNKDTSDDNSSSSRSISNSNGSSGSNGKRSPLTNRTTRELDTRVSNKNNNNNILHWLVYSLPLSYSPILLLPSPPPKNVLLYDVAKTKQENMQLNQEVINKDNKLKKLEQRVVNLRKAVEELSFIRESNNQELIQCEQRVSSFIHSCMHSSSIYIYIILMDTASLSPNLLHWLFPIFYRK